MRRGRLSLMIAILSALPGLVGCKAEEAPIRVPEGAAAGDLSLLETCEFKLGGTAYQAECGTLTVPENWDDPESRLIALPVVRIPATGPNPSEPVFWLGGGPGQPNLTYAPPAWLLDKHDVIEVGYRGADGSVVLACAEAQRLTTRSTGKGILSDAVRSEMQAAAARCVESLRAEGIDLAGYRPSGVIRDMEVARAALGYDRINLYGVSYGTRLAQLYAYMYPQSLHRVVMVGLNTPGHFIYDRTALDAMVRQISDLCAADPDCSQRSQDLYQTIYDVNHNMPERWLFLPIDPDTVRLGTQMMFFSNPNMPMIIDMYLAAGQGDPSGLAMLTLMAKFVFPPFIWGDLLSKGGTLDMPYYQGIESINLSDTAIGAPLAELIWPMANVWPITLEDESLRQLQESEVEMLVVNGELDFSTPPTALDEARPYWHGAQFVVLKGFSHVGDVERLQPEAFERLMTSYYDEGKVDASLYQPQPVDFVPKMSLTLMAKLMVGLMIALPPLLIAGLLLIGRRVTHRTAGTGTGVKASGSTKGESG